MTGTEIVINLLGHTIEQIQQNAAAKIDQLEAEIVRLNQVVDELQPKHDDANELADADTN